MGLGKENYRQEKGRTGNGIDFGLAGVRTCIEKPLRDEG